MLIPNHALVGWKKIKDSIEFEFLETVAIPYLDFNSAIKAAKERIEAALEYLRETNKQTMPEITFEEAVSLRYIRMIDIAMTREQKIFPRNM